MVLIQQMILLNALKDMENLQRRMETMHFFYTFSNHLRVPGKGAIILPHGVLFRGNEAKIRKEIINRGYIKGIIGLPYNLFYGTTIPACIIVIDKENAESQKGIFMIDAK